MAQFILMNKVSQNLNNSEKLHIKKRFSLLPRLMNDLDVIVLLWEMDKIQKTNKNDQELVMSLLVCKVMPVLSKWIYKQRKGIKIIQKIKCWC